MPDKCVLAHIRGRVQGVGFRYNAQIKARELGVFGWVRNLPDGSVESLICDNDSQLKHMQDWLSHGSSHAGVEHITFNGDYSTGDSASKLQDFSVRY